MGVNFYIRRQSSTGIPEPIDRTEWSEIVANDPDLEFATNDKSDDAPLDAFWTAHPDADRGSFFEWDEVDGAIWGQHSDQPELQKLALIAEALDAKLCSEYGDEMTVDYSGGQVIERKQDQQTQRSFLRRLLGL